jgi:hypothetical protein
VYAHHGCSMAQYEADLNAALFLRAEHRHRRRRRSPSTCCTPRGATCCPG